MASPSSSLPQPAPGPWLAANLGALAERQPLLSWRLTCPVDNTPVVFDSLGRTALAWGSGTLPLGCAGDDAERVCDGVPTSGPLFCFGVGDGEILDVLAERRPGQPLVAWDRDPWLWRLALGRRDYGDALRAGRLIPLLGVDLLANADVIRQRPRVAHPALALAYRHERVLCDEDARAPLAFIAAGTLFVDDCAEALRGEGFRVYEVDLRRLGLAEIEHAFADAHPALMFAVNYTDGLTDVCAQQDVPLVCWEIDPSTSALPACRAPVDKTFIFTYRRAHVPLFLNAGFKHVDYLPLAANERRRQPVKDATPTGAPAFVGASLQTEVPRFTAAFDEALATRGISDAAIVLARVRQAQAENETRDIMPALLDVERFGLAGDPVAARAAAEIAAADRRAAMVNALGAGATTGLDLWGDEGWRGVVGRGVRYHGPASHTADLNRIYSTAAVQIDIGRLYQNDIVTMRVFDAAACGGCVLAEWSPALADLFDLDREIAAWRTPADLVTRTEHLCAHPKEARAIALSGRAAVLARHTIAMRMRLMLSRCQAHGHLARADARPVR